MVTLLYHTEGGGGVASTGKELGHTETASDQYPSFRYQVSKKRGIITLQNSANRAGR
jgi:hypothetical protein